jgi:hypothetical protein
VTRGALAAAALVGLASRSAGASAPGTFGHGGRSAALASSDVADPDAAHAAATNAAASAEPGLRASLGYGYASLAMTIDGADAGVRDVSGLDVGAQYGAAVGERWAIGGAVDAHVPDGALARVAFRPATEPQLVLYEATLQRLTIDTTIAVRYGPLALGGGVAWSLDVGGGGSRFTIGQDAGGTYADAAVDVDLPYRAAPVVGARLDLGRAAIGATVRGATAIELGLDTATDVALIDNPLNGDIAVRVRGVSGYDPAVVDAGASVYLGRGLAATASLRYSAYSAAPPPVADVTIDARLGTTPGERQVTFPLPRLRDTVSPRIGIELVWPAPASCDAGDRGDAWRVAVRGGYSFAPSPVPAQTGFTSYADGDRHGAAVGAGYHLGRAAGVDLSLEAAAQLFALASRAERKADPSLPNARYETAGHIVRGAVGLEAAWR